MALWERTAPRSFSVVTGFFPETSPKATWATNPRPLLVCGTATDPETAHGKVGQTDTGPVHPARPRLKAGATAGGRHWQC